MSEYDKGYDMSPHLYELTVSQGNQTLAPLAMILCDKCPTKDMNTVE